MPQFERHGCDIPAAYYIIETARAFAGPGKTFPPKGDGGVSLSGLTFLEHGRRPPAWRKKKKNCPQLQTTPQGLFSWTDQEASGCCPSLPRMAVPGRYGVPDDHLPCSMLFRGPVSGPLEPDQTAEDANPVLEFSPRYL